MKKRNSVESGGQYFTSNDLVSYYNETKKTIQDYVDEIRRHCGYKTVVSQTADGTILDDRGRLMDLYDSCLMQDAHLRSCMETLYSYITGERYALGTIDERGEFVIDVEETKKVQTLDFEKFIIGIQDATAYGYTLFDISSKRNPATGLPDYIGTVERRNVLPSQRRVVKTQGQWMPGWDLDSERYKHNYILIDTCGLGMFATSTPLVLAKKYTVSNWVNFSHTYGQPIIHGKTTATDNESRKRLAQSIVNAAQNKVVVTGTDDAIDIKTFTMSNSERIMLMLRFQTLFLVLSLWLVLPSLMWDQLRRMRIFLGAEYVGIAVLLSRLSMKEYFQNWFTGVSSSLALYSSILSSLICLLRQKPRYSKCLPQLMMCQRKLSEMSLALR